MLDLYDKIDLLKKEINKLSIVHELEYNYNKVMNNISLKNKIDEYNETKDNNLRMDIYQNEEFLAYKKCETDINLLIIEINSRLNKISTERGCIDESN